MPKILSIFTINNFVFDNSIQINIKFTFIVKDTYPVTLFEILYKNYITENSPVNKISRFRYRVIAFRDMDHLI